MFKCEQKCSICGNITPFVIPDIFSIKTAHSETPIDEIIKRLINLKQEISTELLDEEHTFACQNCLIKIDEYDLYYINTEKIQNELINTISKSTKVKDKIEISGISFKQEVESYDIFTDYIEQDEDDIEELKKEISFVAKCEICDVEFNSEEELNQHEHIYQLSDGFSNSDSSSTIIKRKTRQNNVNLTDDIVKTRNKVDECSECGENFNSKGEYKEHIREHKKNKYKCQICEKSFVNEVLLDIHRAVHEGRSELECSYCLKVLSSRGALVKHRRIHLKEYKYQCERCGKQFLHDTSFRMHMYSHDDTRKVSCKICHRQFRCTPHLNRHMRIHTGEKPYSCPTCGKLFAQRYNMMIHYKSHDPNNGEFKCTVCEKSFTIRKRLNEHLKIEHNTILETSEHKFERPKRIAVFDYSDLTEAIIKKE